MAAHGLQPPDLVLVVDGDAVRFVGAVGLQKLPQPQHPLPGRADIGQHQHQDVLLADAAGHVLLAPLPGFLVDHQRVRREDPGVGGDGLRGGHAHVGGVDARGRPDAVGAVHAGAGGVAEGLLGQGHLQVGDDAFVGPGLVLGLHDHQLLHVEVAVVGPGDHGGIVVAGAFADQDGGAGHGRYLLLCCIYLSIRPFRPVFNDGFTTPFFAFY